MGITLERAAIAILNGLPAATQTFAVGTAGTDFAISSATSTHTFNLPDASATARGAVTTGAQTLAGAKTFTSNLTVLALSPLIVANSNGSAGVSFVRAQNSDGRQTAILNYGSGNAGTIYGINVAALARLNSDTTSGLVVDTDGAVPIILATLGTERLRLTGAGKIGLLGATAPANDIGVDGTAARVLGLERHTTANTAGNNLTVQGGGATSAATDKVGGNLLLNSGTATGTGSSDVIIQTVNAGATGTADRSPAETFRVKGNGSIVVPSTIVAPGTTGNQTINKAAGRVNIAAAGTTVTVTNSLVSANSIVLAVAATADATARVTNVVPAAGSFVINTVAVTAETAFDWWVVA